MVEVSWQRLQEPPAIMHATLALQVLPSQSRHMDMPAQKGDGSPCYNYVLLYTDDTLVISENAEGILRDELRCYFELKLESIGPPSIYIGGHVWRVTLENGMSTWSFSASKYVQPAVKNVEAYINNNNATG